MRLFAVENWKQITLRTRSLGLTSEGQAVTLSAEAAVVCVTTPRYERFGRELRRRVHCPSPRAPGLPRDVWLTDVTFDAGEAPGTPAT